MLLIVCERVFFIFEKEKNLISLTVTLVLCINTSCLISVTVADVTGKSNLYLSAGLYQYSPMCTSYLCSTCDWDCDHTTPRKYYVHVGNYPC